MEETLSILNLRRRDSFSRRNRRAQREQMMKRNRAENWKIRREGFRKQFETAEKAR